VDRHPEPETRKREKKAQTWLPVPWLWLRRQQQQQRLQWWLQLLPTRPSLLLQPRAHGDLANQLQDFDDDLLVLCCCCSREDRAFDVPLSHDVLQHLHLVCVRKVIKLLAFG